LIEEIGICGRQLSTPEWQRCRCGKIWRLGGLGNSEQ